MSPDLGLSLVELAKRTGISLAQIYNIETGRTKNPQAKTRQRLAQILTGNADTPCSVTDLTNRLQEAPQPNGDEQPPQHDGDEQPPQHDGDEQPPQHDGDELFCSFCNRPLAETKAIAWLSDERDPAACMDCVSRLTSVFAHSARRDRYDGKAKLRLVPKATTTGHST
jgi:transcriptional regulator with XRE-family HTH domain